MNNQYQLQWFPGHMAKTRRMIQDNLKLVDVVIELVDARIPISSRNPEVDKIINKKPRILVLNKADMADANITQKWLTYFQSQKVTAISANSQSGNGLSKKLLNAIEVVLADKFKRDEARGIKRHAVKMMVLGIPNVGKSSFINRISGRAVAKTGDRPGITQSKQWIRIAGKFELLDTPGILWPKFESESVARKIAFTGGIKDEIIDVETLAYELLDYLKAQYFSNLREKYSLSENDCELDKYELLEVIGKKRGCIISGGEVDLFRAANIVLSDFRAAKLGKITLEAPNA
ncbi:MAG TPA: ribosome biogenesis GTPase YlqF [Candidatus Monoglobus merdigallinarum]|uniref:Ribosome biogenesis GTPase A n=1 Tax=Candidatus Monoglobus merdigallinarum TaxID=2838698 RepID=A0A9D1PPY6_9FIRM|nr:ribosome biogenesis GTPase YlqF [Candidatus Monoglobus merdigallinarum]